MQKFNSVFPLGLFSAVVAVANGVVLEALQLAAEIAFSFF